ncbi:helix-turn-helix domain-containing protein, partial [Actinopolymorpha cephalotaxi]
MSKARLVVTAVVVEGRSQSAVARDYGVSQSWVSRLVARYRAEGQAAFEPRSRRPKTSPTAAPPGTVELIVRPRSSYIRFAADLPNECWQTTPATRSRSPPTARSPAPPCSPAPGKPLPHTRSRRPPSPTFKLGEARRSPDCPAGGVRIDGSGTCSPS